MNHYMPISKNLAPSGPNGGGGAILAPPHFFNRPKKPTCGRVKAIPYWSEERDDGTKENSVVCIKHWPDNFPTK